MLSISIVGGDTLLLRHDKISPGLAQRSCRFEGLTQSATSSGAGGREGFSQNEMVGLCSTRAYAYTNGMCIVLRCCVVDALSGARL